MRYRPAEGNEISYAPCTEIPETMCMITFDTEVYQSYVIKVFSHKSSWTSAAGSLTAETEMPETPELVSAIF